MGKVNFTKEHEKELKALALIFLFNGTMVKGITGTQYSVYDLIHTVTIGTLRTLYSNLKSQIEKSEKMDEWSMDSYQQRLLAANKKLLAMLNLVIGWRMKKEELATIKSDLRSKREELEKLKEATMTPKQQLKAKEAEIAELSELESEFETIEE